MLAIAVHFNMRINAAQSVAKSDNLGASLGPKTVHKSAVGWQLWNEGGGAGSGVICKYLFGAKAVDCLHMSPALQLKLCAYMYIWVCTRARAARQVAQQENGFKRTERLLMLKSARYLITNILKSIVI